MIEFSQVSMVYQTGIQALKNVSFKIVDGEFVFVIGRSGAGKSTLIKLLTCEERPSSGHVLIDKYDISTIRSRLIPYLRRNVGMVFQDFRLIETKSVYENVAFAMEIVGASPRAIRRRVPIVLSIVGLRDKANARPGELAGGEQQRVAIARAMVNNPMIILADEPTGNLDPTNSEAVMAILEDINRSGTTVIICTHDWDLVNRMKRRVIEIDDGLLVRDDCEGGYFCQVPREPLEPVRERSESPRPRINRSRAPAGSQRPIDEVRSVFLENLWSDDHDTDATDDAEDSDYPDLKDSAASPDSADFPDGTDVDGIMPSEPEDDAT